VRVNVGKVRLNVLRLLGDGACSGHVDGTLSPLKRCAGPSCPACSAIRLVKSYL
jgi:hypothetical protein